MKFFIKIAFVALSFINQPLFSQVAINANNSPAQPSAQLDVSSTNKGFLMPRVSHTQMLQIANPAEGLMVYNIDSSAFYVFSSVWIKLITSSNQNNNLSNNTVVFSNNQILSNNNSLVVNNNGLRIGNASNTVSKLSVSDSTSIVANFNNVSFGLQQAKPAIFTKQPYSNSLDTLVLNANGIIQVPSLANSQTSRSFIIVDSKGIVKDTFVLTADGSKGGFVSQSNFNAFASKQNQLSIASSTSAGIISSADWNTFNGKSNYSIPGLPDGSIVVANGDDIAAYPNELSYNSSNQQLAVGSATGNSKLSVNGAKGVTIKTTNLGAGTTDWKALNAGGKAGGRVVMGNLFGKATIGAHNNLLTAWDTLVINPTSKIQMPFLAGSLHRYIVVDQFGNTKDSIVREASNISTGLITNADWNTFNAKSNYSLPISPAGSVLFSNGNNIASSVDNMNFNSSTNSFQVGAAIPTTAISKLAIGGNMQVNSYTNISLNAGANSSDRLLLGNTNGISSVTATDNNLVAGKTLNLNEGGSPVYMKSLAGSTTQLVQANSDGLLSSSPNVLANDGLGNHIASQNIAMGNKSLSKNASGLGIQLSDDGYVGVRMNSVTNPLAIPRKTIASNGLWKDVTNQVTPQTSATDDNSYLMWFAPDLLQRDYTVDFGLGNEKVIKRHWIYISGYCEIGESCPPDGRTREIELDLQGSVDGITWINLDNASHSDDVNYDFFHERILSNPHAYRFYKINFTKFLEGGVDATIQINEWRLFEEDGAIAQIPGAFTLTPNTKVGIGTTTPSTGLDIVGSLRIRNNGIANGYLMGSSDGTASWKSKFPKITTPNLSATNAGIGMAFSTSNAVSISGMGGLKISTTNDNLTTNDWIGATAGSASGNKFVQGNLLGSATIGGHNAALNSWAPFLINGGGTVYMGGANNTIPQNNTNLNTTNPVVLNVMGSIRQAVYMVSIDVPEENVEIPRTTIIWRHNLGYGPITIWSTDENGGGYGMEHVTPVTYNTDANTTIFRLNNRDTRFTIVSLGGVPIPVVLRRAMKGHFRWIVVN